MTLDQIVAWLNKTYPGRNWDQRCQQLVWNVIYCVMGYTSDSQMHTYATATAARLASKIESTDALAAPVGAIHYWRDPAEGHVAIEMGGGQVLMTGTPYALNGGVQRGNNYGTTTVAAYSRVRGNPYLGWARTNGANPSLIGKLADAGTKPTPAPEPEEEDDDMWKPTVHVRTEGNHEYMLAHPEIGKDLKPGEKRKDGDVTTVRGYQVTTDPAIGKAWARMYARGFGQETSRTNRADYIKIQEAAQRVSVELAG